MIYTLQNAGYQVQVKSRGAELYSFIKKNENLEYMWQADPEIWASHAPNLFPIVGELPGKAYEWQGETYHLNRHGFARNSEFALVTGSDDLLELELTDSENSLAVYPFQFRFRVRYRLSGNKLTVTYLVFNPGNTELLFSVGAHPGFRVPLLPEERFSDYFLEFDRKTSLERYLLDADGLLSGETEPVVAHQDHLNLDRELFRKDALVFKHPDIAQITIRNKQNSHGVALSFTGFPYLGIWTKPHAGDFICLEPWCGIAGSAGSTKNLSEKEGINSLEPGEEFERSFSISVF